MDALVAAEEAHLKQKGPTERLQEPAAACPADSGAPAAPAVPAAPAADAPGGLAPENSWDDAFLDAMVSAEAAHLKARRTENAAPAAVLEQPEAAADDQHMAETQSTAETLSMPCAQAMAETQPMAEDRPMEDAAGTSTPVKAAAAAGPVTSPEPPPKPTKPVKPPPRFTREEFRTLKFYHQCELDHKKECYGCVNCDSGLMIWDVYREDIEKWRSYFYIPPDK